MDRVRMGLVALVVLAASALSACNVVATKDPLFSKADASPLAMRDGVWTSPDNHCAAFDETQPADAWPDCASPGLVRHGQLYNWDKTDKAWTPEDLNLMFVTGEPLLLQAHMDQSDGDGVYVYAGIEPKLDAQGRIIALKAWPVLCGPPPPQASGAQAASVDNATQAGTKSPFPGMVMDEKGQNCTTADKGALRRAARLSRQYQQDSIADIHWVRDGER